MQSNTTGHSMEVFCILLIKLSLICSFLHYRQIRKLSSSMESIQNTLNEIGEDTGKTLDYCCAFHETLLDLNEKLSSLPSQAPQSPIKPNNWDSVREAFKGPVRVDNERT